MDKRWDEIKKGKLCTNCLKDCRACGCKKSGHKHNTILHRELGNKSCSDDKGSSVSIRNEIISDNSELVSTEVGNSHNSVSAHCYSGNMTQILLSTAKIDIMDIVGRFHKVRCF